MASRTAVALGAALLLGGCAQAPETQPAESVAPPADSAAAAELQHMVAALEQEMHAQIGVVVLGPEGEQSAGSLTPGPAWSTIKVPLAIAALRANPSLSHLAGSAITVSDNAAAQQLWGSLGGGAAAAEAVEAVLRESGDDHTQVNEQVTRPEFSAFGQTGWALEDQAAFARHLSASTGAAEIEVRNYMAQVASSDSYGLGELGDAHFKGGWGPELNGAYLTRQFGYSGDTAIAVATIPADGSYASGQQVLSELTRRLNL